MSLLLCLSILLPCFWMCEPPPTTGPLHLLFYQPGIVFVFLSNSHSWLLFSSFRSLQKCPLLRFPLTTSPKEGPSLDIVIFSLSSFQSTYHSYYHFTQLSICCSYCYTHILNSGCIFQVWNNARSPPHKCSYLTGLQWSSKVNLRPPTWFSMSPAKVDNQCTRLSAP